MAENMEEKIVPTEETAPEKEVQENTEEEIVETTPVEKPKKEKKAPKEKKPKAEKKEKKGGAAKIAVIIGIAVVAVVAILFILSLIFSNGAKTAFNAKDYKAAYEKLSFPLASLTAGKKNSDIIRYNYVVKVLANEGKYAEGAKILKRLSADNVDLDAAYAIGGFSLCEVGNVGTLGTWAKSTDATVLEPVEWIVLDIQNNGSGGKMALIMTKDVIAFPGTWNGRGSEKASYANSNLKDWCEIDFYKTLSADEHVKNMVLNVTISTEDSPNGNDSGEDVTVHCFAPSAKEVETYLMNNEALNEFLLAKATEAAKKDGVRITKDASAYWLRNVGEESGYAAAVDYTGEIGYDYSMTNGKGIGVRPCMWINLG